MAALYVLQAAGLALVALGAIGRVAPRWTPLLTALVAASGLAAAVLAPPLALLDAGLAFGVDSFSALILMALFITALAGSAFQPPGGRVPAVLGLLVLAVLAADGAGFVLCLGAAGLAQAGWAQRRRTALWAAGTLGLVVAMLALGGLDPRFTAIRALPPDGLHAATVLAATLASIGLLARVLPPGAGGVVCVYAAGRLLLDLAGPTTPGWWGLPVLILGGTGALWAARRMATAPDLLLATTDAGFAAQSLALTALGSALLARGADLLPLAALSVAAALLQLLAWSVWGGLATVCTGAINGMAGGASLVRLGGLMRRTPATGLALLVALASMAALPLTAGFAGLWPVLQALLGAGRAGGLAVLLLVAAAAACAGLVLALLAAGSVRLGGLVLLGVPRSARVAASVEPRRRIRATMGVLTGATALLGLCPGLFMPLIRPGARLLSGAAMEGGGLLLFASSADAPGYAAPILAAAFCAAIALAAWVTIGPVHSTPPWQGGFAEDGVGRANTWPAQLPPLTWPRIDKAWALIAALALAVAAALGWAAR